MRFLMFLLLIVLAAFTGIEHLAIRDIDDADLIHRTYDRILSDLRQKSVDSLNQSIENDGLGKIMSRAADVLTTNITMTAAQMSQPLLAKKHAGEVIVRSRYLIENSNQQPAFGLRYMQFQRNNRQEWIYLGDTTINSFYMNLFRMD